MTTIDVLRVNDLAISWGSCSFKIDDLPVTEIVAVGYEEKLEPRIIADARPNAAPLGMSVGRYSVPRFTFTMLRETATSFASYLTSRAGGGGYGQTLFDFKLQAVEPGGNVLTVAAPYTRVTGKRDKMVEGIDELVTEFDLATLYISENGNRLWTGGTDTLTTLDLLAPNYVTIGGDQSPGKVTIRNFEVRQRWDERQGYGLSFGSLFPTGAVLARAELFFELWTADQLDAWDAFAKKYFIPGRPVAPSGSKTAYALAIGHPVLTAAPMRTAKFVVEACSQLEKDESGVYSSTVKILQYGKPIVAPDKPTVVIPDTTTPQPTAQDSLDNAQTQATSQFLSLAGAPP